MSDISTAGSRVLSHTVYKKTTVIAFLFCTLFWILFRNICIPLLCYNTWLFLNYPVELEKFKVAPYILKGFLTVICLMHLYWLKIIV
jgi:hypothetical protein